MTITKNADDLIFETVSGWPGVSVEPGPRGSMSIRFEGKRELAHLHGDRTAHFAFPKEESRRLKEEGRVTDHPLGDSYQGLAARKLDTDEDIEQVIELIRMNYDRAIARVWSTPRR